MTVPESPAAPPPPWHALSADEALEEVGSGPEGLAHEEAAERLEREGPNRLAPPVPVASWSILVDQFRSLVVLLLLVAAVVAFFVGDAIEAAAIAVVLVLNTGIGFVVELRARRAMEALLSYRVPTARVVRGGVVETLDADSLVPGDVVELEAGDAVPADARLLTASGVRVDEASLTGESVPVGKSATEVAPDAPLPDRTSLLHTGTSVVSGRARAVVVATGAHTELGRIGTLMAGIEEERTPLERRLDALGRRLVGLTLGVAAVVVALGALRGVEVGLMIETGIALAIAAVPEGLPAVVTIALAVGLRRMARRRALVRRLSAVESLGSTTVVCTDKTGTLTAGEMTVTTVATAEAELEVTGVGYLEDGEIHSDGGAPPEALLTAAALTPRAHLDAEGEVTGDPTDAALLVFARKGDIEPDRLRDALPPTGEIPFSSETRLSASFHEIDGEAVAFVKGSPEAILGRCTRVALADAEAPLDESRRERLERLNEEMAGNGLRVIALARGAPPTRAGDPTDLVFLGLVGMIDPPAEGVRETLGRFRDAGIRTVMITGDQAVTAAAVGRSLDLSADAAGTIDAPELARLDDAALADRVGTAVIFSRVSPDQKLRIVAAMQGRGEIVAMLGDGVNDAAALRKSDVGVAMGRRGTDVAKEAADLVLQDDRFSTLSVAVEEGRVIYDNIRKFVFYLFGCNLAEVLVLLGAGIAGLPLPLLPLQILWLNLVTDTFPALALALEPGEPDIMSRPPRDPREPIMSRRFLGSLGFFALLITAVTLAAHVQGLRTGSPERAVTLTFMTLALAQLFHLGNARSRGPVLRPSRILANPWALGSVPLVLALQLLAVYWPPLSRMLGTVPLPATDWLLVGGLALLPAIIGQGLELAQARRARGP